MSPKQTAFYFREWSYVRGYCKAHRLPEPDRHELHVRALGIDKSSKDFTNEDFDKVLAVFRSIHQPANLNSQIRQLRQPRKRAEFPFPELLKLLGLYIGDPEAYVAEICQDKFGTPYWQDLDHEPHPEKANPKEHSSQLERLRYTLNRCLNGKGGLRNQAGDSLHDMRTKAGLECGCKACAMRRITTPAFIGVPVMAGALDDNEPF